MKGLSMGKFSEKSGFAVNNLATQLVQLCYCFEKLVGASKKEKIIIVIIKLSQFSSWEPFLINVIWLKMNNKNKEESLIEYLFKFQTICK